MAELPKVEDADKESQYGFVFGVSGPGKTYLSVVFSFLCMRLWVGGGGGVVGDGGRNAARQHTNGHLYEQSSSFSLVSFVCALPIRAAGWPSSGRAEGVGGNQTASSALFGATA